MTKNQKKLMRDHPLGAHVGIFIDECPYCVAEVNEKEQARQQRERGAYHELMHKLHS